MTQDMSADEIIQILGLERHPEGGWYRQTWVEDTGEDTRRPSSRPCGTCIYLLLGAGERSHWRRSSSPFQRPTKARQAITC